MTQADINTDTALVTSIAASVVTITAGIDALKAAAGGTADTSELDTALADLKAKVDAASTDVTPPAAPVEPTPGPVTTGDVATDAPADPNPAPPATA